MSTSASLSTGSLRIAAATEEDIPVILEFIRALAKFEKLADRVKADERRLKQTIFGPEPKAYVVLAYDGDTAVGYAVYFHTYSTFLGLPGLYLEDLFVKAEARGKGVGKALLSYLAQLAKDKQCWGIQWAVLHWNEPAIRFYKRLGAARIDEWAVYSLEGEALDRLAAAPEDSPAVS